MSHEEFCQEVYSRLFDLISRNSTNSIDHLQEQSNLFISIRRFDDSTIDICLPSNARVFQLKKSIEQVFANEKLNWKSIWKKYYLITSNHQQLTNNNQTIQYYHIENHSQLSFFRRRRLK